MQYINPPSHNTKRILAKLILPVHAELYLDEDSTTITESVGNAKRTLVEISEPVIC